MQISMSVYPKNFIPALLTPLVKTQLVPTSAGVFLGTKAMDGRVQTLMNVTSVSKIAVFIHIAIIPSLLITVHVIKDSKKMGSHVKISMNVNWSICTIAVLTHTAITL